MDYQPPEPRVADQELYDNIYLPTKSMRAFDNLRDPIVNIVDYPCGFGKTNVLLSILNDHHDLKVLVVVQTLSEVDRIIKSLPKGRIFSPEKANPRYKSKGEQLEHLVRKSVSVVITHSLYERAGMLAYNGGFRNYHVIIDEVPNAVSVLENQLYPENFKEFYIDNGYFKLENTGLILPTEKVLEEEDRLKNALDETLINNINSGRVYFDGKKNFIKTIPTSLFTETETITVLTFLSKGTLFLKFLKKYEIKYKVTKSATINEAFKQLAAKNLSIKTIKAVNDIGLGYAKQTTYPIKSKEVKTIRTALKNLKQRTLINVELE